MKKSIIRLAIITIAVALLNCPIAGRAEEPTDTGWDMPPDQLNPDSGYITYDPGIEDYPVDSAVDAGILDSSLPDPLTDLPGSVITVQANNTVPYFIEAPSELSAALGATESASFDSTGFNTSSDFPDLSGHGIEPGSMEWSFNGTGKALIDKTGILDDTGRHFSNDIEISPDVTGQLYNQPTDDFTTTSLPGPEGNMESLKVSETTAYLERADRYTLMELPTAKIKDIGNAEGISPFWSDSPGTQVGIPQKELDTLIGSTMTGAPPEAFTAPVAFINLTRGTPDTTTSVTQDPTPGPSGYQTNSTLIALPVADTDNTPATPALPAVTTLEAKLPEVALIVKTAEVMPPPVISEDRTPGMPIETAKTAEIEQGPPGTVTVNGIFVTFKGLNRDADPRLNQDPDNYETMSWSEMNRKNILQLTDGSSNLTVDRFTKQATFTNKDGEVITAPVAELVSKGTIAISYQGKNWQIN